MTATLVPVPAVTAWDVIRRQGFITVGTPVVSPDRFSQTGVICHPTDWTVYSWWGNALDSDRQLHRGYVGARPPLPGLVAVCWSMTILGRPSEFRQWVDPADLLLEAEPF